MVTIDIDAVSKPRQTQSDRWRKRPCVVKYRAFADELRLKCKLQKVEVTDSLDVKIVVAMPKSWSKKKKERMCGAPHQQRPDIDNFCKSVMDSLLEEDSAVADLKAVKRWGHTGSITFY